MISIPEKYEGTIIGALKLQRAAFEQVLNMTEYQMLEYWSQLEQFAFVKEMMASKSLQDLVEDMEIKALLTTQMESIKKEQESTIELIQYFESLGTSEKVELN